MKPAHVLSIFFVSAVSMLACSASSGAGASVPTQACGHETVEAYCAQHTCETFDQVAEAVRRQDKEAIATNAMFRYAIGTCGSYRTIDTQTMGMSRTFYDASGRLAAMDAVADAPMCGNEMSMSVGTAPKCEPTIIERGGAP